MLVALFAPLARALPAERAAGRSEYITPTHIPGPGELAEFPLGLDRFGGDVLSKLIWGAQASLIIGVVSTAFGLVGGMLLGLLAGMFGGWVDNVIMRFVDILLSVPNLLLAVSIAALLGQTPFVGDDRDRRRAGADLRAAAARRRCCSSAAPTTCCRRRRSASAAAPSR